jgi:hypothetical protein
MNLRGLIQDHARLCHALFLGAALALTGCGGGGGSSASASLSSINVIPGTAALTVGAGNAVRLAAIGTYSNGSNADLTAQVVWSSASSVIATVTGGVVTGAAVGSTTISASLNGIASTAAVTVTSAPSYTTGLASARWDHSATLLPASGVAGERVLVTGGYISASGISATLDSSELYDATTALWSSTGRLNTPRGDHTATRLLSGQVLVAGGEFLYSNMNTLTSSELYDPNTGQWSYTAGGAAGGMHDGRSYHTATLLNDGTVLAVGGAGTANPSLASAELYDPASQTWSVAGPLAAGRYSHTATLLPSGKVLVTGGVNLTNGSASYLSASELYDPAAKTWSATGSMATGRFSHTATLLNAGPHAGKVLVIGGVDSTGAATGSVELYDPATGLWSAMPPLNVARALHTATLLANGTVLVMGGDDFGAGGEMASIELYDPAVLNATASAALLSPSLSAPRDNFTATLLNSIGKVLAAGGSNASGPLSSTDLRP